MATPSPLLLTSSPPGTSLPAVSTTLSPTRYTSIILVYDLGIWYEGHILCMSTSLHSPGHSTKVIYCMTTSLHSPGHSTKVIYCMTTSLHSPGHSTKVIYCMTTSLHSPGHSTKVIYCMTTSLHSPGHSTKVIYCMTTSLHAFDLTPGLVCHTMIHRLELSELHAQYIKLVHSVNIQWVIKKRSQFPQK